MERERMIYYKLKYFFLIKFFFLGIFLLGNFQLAALQAQTKVVADLIAEFSDDLRGIAPSFGSSIDHKLTPKSGIESGLYYRTYLAYGYTNIPKQYRNDIYFFEVNEQYLSLPILYKFHTKIVNIATGPTVDFFLGWKQVSGKPEVKVEDYSVTPRFGLGVMLKVGKIIPLA